MTFDATRTYQSELDVRDWSRWKERLLGEPEGALWALIGPRRAGKTWALQALASRDSVYINLQNDPRALERNYTKSRILIDEPGSVLRRQRLTFLDRCLELKASGTRVLVAMTLGEWEYLSELDPEERRVKPRDCLALPQLTDEQALKLARTDWARRLLVGLPGDWCRNPFLLELLFETAEDSPDLCQKQKELILATIRASERARFRYVHYVFKEGLSEAQRSAIRQIARGEREVGEAIEMLRECGLVSVEPRVTDPILAHYFREPLIVHHISDLHFGPKSASGVDRKEEGEHGKRLAAAAGAHTVRDDYLALIGGAATIRPHAVLVSGDLVETGTSDQYEDARAFLHRVSELLVEHPDLRPGDPRLAIVGGNHDVDWGETHGSSGARKRHLAFARNMTGFPHPHLEEPPERRSLSTVTWPGVGVEIALLGSAEFGGEEDEIQSRLVDLLDALSDQAREAFEAEEFERFDELAKKLSRLDPGLIHHHDLRRIESHNWSQPVRIAVLHHPVSPMPTGVEIARFGGLLNAGSVKASLFRADVCLVLHGHQHSGWFGMESWPGRNEGRVLRIAAAPTLGSRESVENLGFNEIRIFREGAEHYEIQVRRVAYDGNGWDPTDDTMTFELSDS